MSEPISIKQLRTVVRLYDEGDYSVDWGDEPVTRDEVVALLDAVEAAADPQLGRWSREGEAATRRLNDALARFDFGEQP